MTCMELDGSLDSMMLKGKRFSDLDILDLKEVQRSTSPRAVSFELHKLSLFQNVFLNKLRAEVIRTKPADCRPRTADRGLRTMQTMQTADRADHVDCRPQTADRALHADLHLLLTRIFFLFLATK